MLTNSAVGAIFFCITIYLVLVIFVPWEKIKITKIKHSILTYLVSLAVCLIIVIPLWNNIVGIFPSPFREPVRTANASIQVSVSSNESLNAWYMDGKGYLAFGKGQNPLLLIAITKEVRGNQVGNNTILYTATLDMDIASNIVLQKIINLRQAEFIQIGLSPLPDASVVIGGKVTVVINNSVKLEFVIAPQISSGHLIIIDGIHNYLNSVIR